MDINYFTVRYNVTGTERKRLADCIAGFLGCEKKYLGVPSCAYQAGYIEVSRDGAIRFDDRADSEEIEALLDELETQGFHAETEGAPADALTDGEPALDRLSDTARSDAPTARCKAHKDFSEELSSNVLEAPQNAPEALTEGDATEDLPADSGSAIADGDEVISTEPTADGTLVGFTVSVPLDKVHVGNLTALLDAKGALIQKALGITTTPIEVGESTVSFPWFDSLPDVDTASAYTVFISALCKASCERKRITAKAKAVDNEKYAFRCFLLSLDFIGDEYKTARKILLRNLSGNSAFRSGKNNPAR